VGFDDRSRLRQRSKPLKNAMLEGRGGLARTNFCLEVVELIGAWVPASAMFQKPLRMAFSLRICAETNA
jgi:hypothetical protein